MKKILLSAFTIFAMVAVVAGGTHAVFSDTVTSNGNTFSAGTLTLNVDGKGHDQNDVKFTATNLKPGDLLPMGTYVVKNVGTVNGVLNLNNIAVTDSGTLKNVMNIKLSIVGPTSLTSPILYNGPVSGLSSSYLIGSLNANGGMTNVTAQLSWPSRGDNAADNAAQGDSMTLGMSFDLTQAP